MHPQRNWRAASPGGKRPAAFGTSAARMGLPHLADSSVMGLQGDSRPRSSDLGPPKVAYVPTKSMRNGSADGSGWSHAERTRSWTDGLRAKDRGGPIEYVTQERTRTWNETSPRALGPGSARNHRARSPHRQSGLYRPPPPPRRSASAQRRQQSARLDRSAPARGGGGGGGIRGASPAGRHDGVSRHLEGNFGDSEPASPGGRSFSSDIGNGAPSHVSFNPEADYQDAAFPATVRQSGGISGKRMAFIEYWASAVAKHGVSLEDFVREKNGREQPSKFRFLFGAGELGLPEHEEIAAEGEREYFYDRVVRPLPLRDLLFFLCDLSRECTESMLVWHVGRPVGRRWSCSCCPTGRGGRAYRQRWRSHRYTDLSRHDPRRCSHERCR